MEISPQLANDDLLKREAQGDVDLHGLILRREAALDDFLKNRHNYDADERELLETYSQWAFVVKAYKEWEGIEEPVYSLESDG